MTSRPKLRQFGDLRPRDFEDHPVWVNCHVIDYDEPWYEDTDEETFRPWTDALPINPNETMFLVKAVLTLADGTKLTGFLTPQAIVDQGESNPFGGDPMYPLGEIQPHLFLPDGGPAGFWCGISTPTQAEMAGVYKALGKGAEEVFPLTFKAENGLVAGAASGSVPGFCSYDERSRVRVTK